MTTIRELCELFPADLDIPLVLKDPDRGIAFKLDVDYELPVIDADADAKGLDVTYIMLSIDDRWIANIVRLEPGDD